MKASVFAGIVAIAVAPLALAQQKAPSPPPRSVEPRAEEVLKQMSDFLAKSSHFALEAEETFDEIPDGEPRRGLTNVRRVAVERPNRLAADASGDTLNRAAWYDGRTLTALDKEHNRYASVEAPATIDATLDMLEEKYGVVLPLADLLFSDPYAVLTEKVTYGRYLGIHQAAGVPCHHLVFAQDTIEWQIWIDAGEKPLPRKLVISYVEEPGEPQYAATIRKWNLEPQFPAELFRFEAPEGAERVEPGALRPPQGDGQ